MKDCNFGFYHHDPEDRYIWDIDVFAHYYITGEKAVNGKIYKQFVESKSCDYASGTEIALIREEDKKVYLLDGEKEWLWYDFTLEKGDTITIESASPLNPSGEKLKIPVVNTDTFEIGGKLRKRIYLRGYDTWIEGLGTENRLPLHSFEPSCGMDCGDKLYYQRIGDKISYLDNYFIHDIVGALHVVGLRYTNRSLAYRPYPRCPDCDLAGHRLSIGRAHRDDRPIGVVCLLGQRSGRSNDSHRHPIARSVYRHPIERPGRTHRTESDDKIKDKTNGKEPKYEKTIAIDCRVDSMER